MDLDDLLTSIPVPKGKRQRWVAAYRERGSDLLNHENLQSYLDAGWSLRPPETLSDEQRKHYENFYHPDYGEGLRVNELVLLWCEKSEQALIDQAALIRAMLAEENQEVDQWMARHYGERWEQYKDDHPGWRVGGEIVITREGEYSSVLALPSRPPCRNKKLRP